MLKTKQIIFYNLFLIVFVNMCQYSLLNRGGSIMIFDFGRVVMKSDLQTSTVGLEDATQMELEERLYDRHHLDFSDLQLIFCDSGNYFSLISKFSLLINICDYYELSYIC